MVAAGNYNRKKQPEETRRAILHTAEQLATGQGAAAVTIQAVALAAGVTKGGVLHHFPSKQALLEALFASVLARLDGEIDRHLKDDAQAWGAFTRAYVDVLLVGKEFGAGSPFDALSLVMISERALAEPWDRWLAGRLERHKDTDSDPALEVVRLAADGAWPALLGRKPDSKLTHLQARLHRMTRAAPER